ncbi:MAG: helix-turn-helix transcriptional regulator [Erysipelotrichales bacterium]|nr:helix-turn-helix transcriptional regulator [Erysipelotrichales bacterium]
MVNQQYVAEQISYYRKKKHLTQVQLAERLNITAQAVSKWERGECLPDTAILLDLANVLETTVDNLLNGGRIIMEYTDRIDVAEIIDAMNGFKKLKKALGKDNYMYRIIMDALNEKMNSDIESCFESEYETEMMYAEAIVQKIETGSYIDLDEIRKYIKHKKWQDIITSYANKHGIQ